MFYHIFRHRLICIWGDKTSLFWSAAFPIIMATLFGLALGSISSSDSFQEIPVAIVSSDAYQSNQGFREAIAAASTGDDSLFSISVVSESKALAMVDDGAVYGAMRLDSSGEISLFFKSSGLRQTIIESFADTYVQMSSAYRTILTENPRAFASLVSGAVYEQIELQEMNPGSAFPDNVTTYYFALIAMACMYGSFQGLTTVSVAQANQSPVARRNNMAPISKLMIFGASLSAALLVQAASALLLVAYLRWIIGVSFGPRIGYVALTCVAGSLMGVTFGAMISALLKKREGIKVAVVLAVSMTCSFLAGMMFADMKYIVQKNVPILSYINPANLVADAFYALYYYDGLGRYSLNMWLLAAFSALFFLVVHIVMRRQRYESL
jgi:ABC-2 type transport system permease protein